MDDVPSGALFRSLCHSSAAARTRGPSGARALPPPTQCRSATTENMGAYENLRSLNLKYDNL